MNISDFNTKYADQNAHAVLVKHHVSDYITVWPSRFEPTNSGLQYAALVVDVNELLDDLANLSADTGLIVSTEISGQCLGFQNGERQIAH